MFANLKDHKNRDVVFIEDNISIENDLKMCQSGRNESSMVVVMINNRNHLCVGDGEERNEQVGDHLVGNEDEIK